jgi:hypothetical protein
MAGTSRALTLKLLADINDFTKNINKADNEVTGFGDKIGKFGKMAGAAFAAAGVAAAAYAGKLLVDGVKSAIEDEAAQAKLATTLKNVTGATDAQIAAVEKQILNTSLLTGKTDDELRPSFERFLRATNDSSKALKLQQVALDVAAGSGKSLEAVTNAMAKAAEGNGASLAKLGIGLTAAELKTMSLDQITKSLADTFGGQAAQQADTFQGKMARLQVAFDEGKETVGAFVLDAITPMVEMIVKYVVPAIQGFVEGFQGGDGLKNAFEDIIQIGRSIFIPLIDGIRLAFDRVKKMVIENKDSFKDLWNFIKDYLAPFLGGVFKIAIQGIGIAITVVISAVARLIDLFKEMFALASALKDIGGDALDFINPFNNSSASTSSMPSVPKSGSLGIAASGASAVNYNVTVNGAIDPIGTARSISNVLGNAATSSGSFLNLGLSNAVYV